MSKSPLATQLADVLERSGFISVRMKVDSPGSIRLLLRIVDKARWCDALEQVLLLKRGWTEHVCQQYFIRGQKLVYGWTFVLTADKASELDGAVADACKLFDSALSTTIPKQKSSCEVEEMPLVGAGAFRTAKIAFDPRAPGPSRGGPSHKGAYAVGSGD